MRRASWLVLLGALAGCDGGEGGAVADLRIGNRDPQTLVVGRPLDAITLDPALVTDNESAELIFQLYDTLVEWEPGAATVAPGLATSWSVDETGRVWTFELARGVRFHDGTPMDADAVVFSLERQRDPDHPFHRPDFQYWPNSFKNIERVEKVDDDTVRITIDGPYAPFLANMTMFPVAIVSPTAVRAHGDAYGEHPVGTGPFVLESWERGERVVLRRNPDYWRRDRVPRMERIAFAVIEDPRQRLVALESGAVDLAASILPEELQFVALHPGLVLHQTAANNVSFMAINVRQPGLDDVRVRRAIAHAVNKAPIVQLAFQGLAVTSESPLPPTQWGHHEARTRYPYDPAAARRLLAEAQADGRWDPARRLTLYAPSTPRPYLPSPERVARAVQANLADAGIPTDLVLQPFPEHLKSVRNLDHDLCVLGWVGDNGDPDNFLQQLDRDNAAPGSAINVAAYDDPIVHGLLEEARKVPDRLERERLYARVQELVAEHSPWVPLAHSQFALAARADVAGILLNPTGQVIYRAVDRVRE